MRTHVYIHISLNIAGTRRGNGDRDLPILPITVNHGMSRITRWVFLECFKIA